MKRHSEPQGLEYAFAHSTEMTLVLPSRPEDRGNGGGEFRHRSVSEGSVAETNILTDPTKSRRIVDNRTAMALVWIKRAVDWNGLHAGC